MKPNKYNFDKAIELVDIKLMYADRLKQQRIEECIEKYSPILKEHNFYRINLEELQQRLRIALNENLITLEEIEQEMKNGALRGLLICRILTTEFGFNAFRQRYFTLEEVDNIGNYEQHQLLVHNNIEVLNTITHKELYLRLKNKTPVRALPKIASDAKFASALEAASANASMHATAAAAVASPNPPAAPKKADYSDSKNVYHTPAPTRRYDTARVGESAAAARSMNPHWMLQNLMQFYGDQPPRRHHRHHDDGAVGVFAMAIKMKVHSYSDGHLSIHAQIFAMNLRGGNGFLPDRNYAAGSGSGSRNGAYLEELTQPYSP